MLGKVSPGWALGIEELQAVGLTQRGLRVHL